MNKKTVLIVDDCEVQRYLLNHIITEGFEGTIEVEERTDGLLALDYIKKFNEKIAIVLSDINMPNMDGIELAKIIKNQHQKIPLIMLSSNITDYQKQLSDIGVPEQLHFQKPIPDHKIFVQTLRRFIKAIEI